MKTEKLCCMCEEKFRVDHRYCADCKVIASKVAHAKRVATKKANLNSKKTGTDPKWLSRNHKDLR